MPAGGMKACFHFPERTISTCKDNANEGNVSLLTNCRVQLIFCKDKLFNPYYILPPPLRFVKWQLTLNQMLLHFV